MISATVSNMPGRRDYFFDNKSQMLIKNQNHVPVTCIS